MDNHSPHPPIHLGHLLRSFHPLWPPLRANEETSITSSRCSLHEEHVYRAVGAGYDVRSRMRGSALEYQGGSVGIYLLALSEVVLHSGPKVEKGRKLAWRRRHRSSFSACAYAWLVIVSGAKHGSSW